MCLVNITFLDLYHHFLFYVARHLAMCLYVVIFYYIGFGFETDGFRAVTCCMAVGGLICAQESTCTFWQMPHNLCQPPFLHLPLTSRLDPQFLPATVVQPQAPGTSLVNKANAGQLSFCCPSNNACVCFPHGCPAECCPGCYKVLKDALFLVQGSEFCSRSQAAGVDNEANSS